MEEAEDRAETVAWVRASRVEDLPDEITDEEAADLFPPATADEADRRADEAEHRAVRAAQRVEDLPDEELHALLFGDQVGAFR